MTAVTGVEGGVVYPIDQATPVSDLLRLETVAIGHVAPRGSVHVTDHVIAASAGQPSIFNRACALDREQPHIGIGELERFFGKLPHTLWLQERDVDAALTTLLGQRGYLALPPQTGLVRPPEPVLGDPLHGVEHAEILTDPAMSSVIAEVTASGFGFRGEDRLLLEDLTRAVLRHTKPWDHGALYGVRHDGALVATSALLCTNSIAGITAVSTLPTARHHGYGTMAVQRAIRDAAALGYTTAAAIATPDSRSILDDLGFEPVMTYRVYRRSAS